MWHSVCRHWHSRYVEGASALVGKDPLGHFVFIWGVKGGATIHKAFPSCEMMSDKHFFDVGECFVVPIYLESFNEYVCVAKR